MIYVTIITILTLALYFLNNVEWTCRSKTWRSWLCVICYQKMFLLPPWELMARALGVKKTTDLGGMFARNQSNHARCSPFPWYYPHTSQVLMTLSHFTGCLWFAIGARDTSETTWVQVGGYQTQGRNSPGTTGSLIRKPQRAVSLGYRGTIEVFVYDTGGGRFSLIHGPYRWRHLGLTLPSYSEILI